MDNQERRTISITVEQLQELADMAATKAAEKTATATVVKLKTDFFISIGEGLFSKVAYLVGAGLVWLWWNMEGMKLPFGK